MCRIMSSHITCYGIGSWIFQIIICMILAGYALLRFPLHYLVFYIVGYLTFWEESVTRRMRKGNQRSCSQAAGKLKRRATQTPRHYSNSYHHKSPGQTWNEVLVQSCDIDPNVQGDTQNTASPLHSPCSCPSGYNDTTPNEVESR